LLFIALALLIVAHLETTNNIYDYDSKPEQIGLNYGSETSQIVITWADFGKDATYTNAIVKFGFSIDQLIYSVEATGQTYTYQIYTSPMLYKANLNGLIEGKKIYYYHVGSTEGIYSDVYSFKTHPGIGVDSVKFHLVGDLGQTENSKNNLIGILDNEQAMTGYLVVLFLSVICHYGTLLEI
jgi:hypothetical protein